jgi:hypothetical protein
MSINQPNDQQQQPLSPRIVFEQDNTRYVELHTAYSNEAMWVDAILRLEAAYHGKNIILCQMHSEESPIKLIMNAQALHRLIIGYLDYLADYGIVVGDPIAEHPLVQAFTRYMHSYEVERASRPMVVQPHKNQNDFFDDDDLSDLDEHPF